MAITGVNSASKEIVGNILGQNGQNDAISKNIKNEIARAQKKLQDLSANNELSIEDKMKKRQEILQEIIETIVGVSNKNIKNADNNPTTKN